MKSTSNIIHFSGERQTGRDRLGGIPDHLPLSWPRCQHCSDKLQFVAQFYDSSWTNDAKVMALQLYSCFECRKNVSNLRHNLMLHALPVETEIGNDRGLGIVCEEQRLQYLSYIVERDPTDQWSFLEGEFAAYDLEMKYPHLAADKVGGLFLYEGCEGLPTIERNNYMIAQLHLDWFGAVLYFYRSIEYGYSVYAYT